MWKIFKKISNRNENNQSRNNGKVLIVEEDQTYRQFLCQVLEEEHFRPVVAEKGSVVEIAASIGPCLVILNSLISGKKTLDLCAKLKAMDKTKQIPVLVISEKEDTSDIIDYYSQNVDCFLKKPVTKKELIKQVKTLCPSC